MRIFGRKPLVGSLRARLLLALILISTLPLALVGVATASMDRQTIAQQSSRELIGYSMGAADHLGDYVTEHLIEGRALAALPEIQTMSPERQQATLQSLNLQMPDYTRLSTFTLNGDRLASSPNGAAGNVGHVSSFQQARQGNQAWEIARSPSTDRWSLLINTPIRNDQHQVVGVLGMVIDLENLSNVIGHLQTDGDTVAFVLDSDGRVLLHPNYQFVSERRDYSWLNLPSQGHPAGPGVLHFQDNGHGYVAGYAPVSNTGWTVIVERPEWQVYAAADNSWHVALVGLAASIALSVVAAILLSRALTRPLRSLVKAVQTLGTENPDVPPLPVAADTEITALVHAFADLRDRLGKRTVERERAERALRLIVEASAVLASSLELEETLESVARAAIPGLADWCAVDLLDDGSIRRAAVAHRNPALEAAAYRRVGLYPARLTDQAGVGKVIRTGEAEVYGALDEVVLRELARNSDHLAVLRSLDIHSTIIVPLRLRGRVIGSMQFVTDVSGRSLGSDDLAIASELARRAALAVEHARLYREARNAVEVRDEFLSVAAHELKTPITSLKGNVQVLLRALARDRLTTDRLERSLRVVDAQSTKLARLVEQLLDVSRIVGGRLRLERTVVNLGALTAAVCAEAEATTERHQIRVQVARPELTASVDTVRLEQVMRNLLDNAVKYSPDGGAIDVTVEQADSATARIAVRDHGLGIPEDRRARIFDRFYRAHDDSYASGMGLGLNICHDIVELHGGTIFPEFPADGGTRMVILLPTSVPVDDHQPRLPTAVDSGNYSKEP